jgi:archaellum component FlaC
MTGRGRGYCAVPLSARVEDLDYLKEQARAMRRELEQIESRIKKLEKPNSAVTKE